MPGRTGYAIAILWNRVVSSAPKSFAGEANCKQSLPALKVSGSNCVQRSNIRVACVPDTTAINMLKLRSCGDAHPSQMRLFGRQILRRQTDGGLWIRSWPKVRRKRINWQECNRHLPKVAGNFNPFLQPQHLLTTIFRLQYHSRHLHHVKTPT
jgi:hypothetical protein